MPEINAVITNAGLKKMLTHGVADQLSYIVLGEGKYKPEKTQTELKEPKLKITNVSLSFKQDNHIALTCRTDAEVTVMVSEIGIFTKDDVLFSVWADEEPCFFKGKHERVRYTINLALTDEPDLSIPVPEITKQNSEVFSPEKEDLDYSLFSAQLNMGMAQIRNSVSANNKEKS